ncbi:MAG: NADH-quinone oxidoreductase subunit C [Spirochaetes bacterium]|nr:NADH-quinone oxidoreductase subunit C [Spirochaetota bacterium]
MNELIQILSPFAVQTPAATSYPEKGYHIDAAIIPERMTDAAAKLREASFALESITGVDWPEAGQCELVYDFYHWGMKIRAALRIRVTRDNGEVQSISSIYKGAAWHEREAHDFFGIRFSGLDDHTPLLLAEDADYHPLRKDYGK